MDTQLTRRLNFTFKRQRNRDLAFTEYNTPTNMKSNFQVGLGNQMWTGSNVSLHLHGKSAPLNKLYLFLQYFFQKKSDLFNNWDDYIIHRVTGMLSQN